jgi:hypothetical protein
MTDLNTPAWLTPEADAPAAVAQPASVGDSLAPAPGNSATSNAETDATAEDPELPGVILTMRLANMAAASALIVISVGLERIDDTNGLKPVLSLTLSFALYRSLG